MVQSKLQLPGLTGIRFFAALAVLLTHYNGRSVPPLIRTYLDHGNTAVGLFFILSGFVLAYTYGDAFQEGSIRVREFWQARIARIYPMHLVTLLSSSLVIALIGTYSNRGLWKLVWSWLLDLLLLHAWAPGRLEWNSPSWSISHEMFFYAVFPTLVAVIASHVRSAQRLSHLLIAVWFIQIAAIWAGYALFHNHPLSEQILAFGPVFRFWEFALGVVAGLLFVRIRIQPETHLLGHLYTSKSLRNVSLTAVLVATALVPLLDQLRQQMGDSRSEVWSHNVFLFPFYTPLFVGLILILASGPTLLSPLLDHPLIVLLGEASYSLYMIHWTFLLVIYHFAPSGSLVRLLALAIATPFIIGCSVITYRFIELPARNRLRPSRRPRHIEESSPATSLPLTGRKTRISP